MKNILNEALEIWEIEDFYSNKSKYKEAYIYCFYNKTNQKLYIGSSSRLVGRFSNYYRAINGTAKFHSIVLKRVFSKYKKNDFLFLILEKIEDKKNIVEREQFYLDKYQPFDSKGYNLAPLASSNFGVKHSEEFKKAASLRQQGEKGNNVRLTNEDIVNIFNDAAFLNLKYKQLGEKYNISKKQIGEILNRHQWSHIFIEQNILERVKEKAPKIMSKEDAELIGRKLKNGQHPKNISLEFNIPIANIHNINIGKSFAEIKQSLSPNEKYIYDFKPNNKKDENLRIAIKNELKLTSNREEVSKKLGVSISLVSQIKKEMNIQNPQRVITLDEAFEVGRLLLQEIKYKNIMELCNICEVSISRINKGIIFPEVKEDLVGNSLYIRTPPKIISLKIKKEIVRLIKGGHKDKYILSQIPISKSYLVKWRKMYNKKYL